MSGTVKSVKRTTVGSSGAGTCWKQQPNRLLTPHWWPKGYWDRLGTGVPLLAPGWSSLQGSNQSPPDNAWGQQRKAGAASDSWCELALGFLSFLPPCSSLVLHLCAQSRPSWAVAISPEKRMSLSPTANLSWSHLPTGSGYGQTLRWPVVAGGARAGVSCPAPQARQAEPYST